MNWNPTTDDATCEICGQVDPTADVGYTEIRGRDTIAHRSCAAVADAHLVDRDAAEEVTEGVTRGQAADSWLTSLGL